MSIARCNTHDISFDTDFNVECPLCELEALNLDGLVRKHEAHDKTHAAGALEILRATASGSSRRLLAINEAGSRARRSRQREFLDAHLERKAARR